VEIFANKLIALALRPNRVKNRDVWDLFWLAERNVKTNGPLVLQKLSDHRVSAADFSLRYSRRVHELENVQNAFLAEMRRFLSPSFFDAAFTAPLWWEHLLLLLLDSFACENL